MQTPLATHSQRPALVTAILALTGMGVSLMQTLVVPLLPHLSTILHTSPDDATWVLTTTLITGAVSTPIAGRLGDMHGKKRVLLVTVASMAVGSLTCALSNSLTPMLVGRALQGVSIGAVALGISLMRDTLPRERLGSAVALMSATLGIGGAIGLPLASVVAEHWSWHYLFIGSAVIGAISMIAVALVVPESSVRAGGRFDAVGATTLSLMLFLLLFGFTKSRAWGWGDPRVIGCFVLAAVFAVLFWRLESRSASPLVDTKVLARPTVRYTNAASILVGFAMYSSNLVITQLLQAPTNTGYGFGQSMAIAGLCAAPQGALMMLMSPVAARLIKHHGPKLTFITGLVVIAAGFLAGIFMLQRVWEAIVVAMLVGTGVALSYAAAPTLIMRAAPPTQTAAANSVNTLSRSIGTSLASAVHGAILATAFVAGGTAYGPLDPFQLCFSLAVLACLGAVLLAWRIPATRPEPAQVTVTEADEVQALADIEEPAAGETLDELSRPAPRSPRPHAMRRPAARRRRASTRPARHRTRK